MSFHGTSSPARARSICHGVWPPLTATMKRPRAFTAARDSVAMISAAFCATASASRNISIFIKSPLRDCVATYDLLECHAEQSEASRIFRSYEDEILRLRLIYESFVKACYSRIPSSVILTRCYRTHLFAVLSGREIFRNGVAIRMRVSVDP